MAASDWNQSVSGLQEELSKLNKKNSRDQIDLRHDANDFESFQAALDDICTRYSKRDSSRLVRDKITPHLLHIQSFERVVAACSQTDKTASLIWGVSQAVIECACRFSKHLDQTFDQLSEFYKSLPLFEEYINLLPEEPALRYPLRDLYNDYSHFSILTIKYMSKPPLTQMVRNVFQSKSHQKLQTIRDNVQTHKNDFNEALDLIMRRRAIRGNSSRLLHTPSDRESALPEKSPSRSGVSKDQAGTSMAFSIQRPRENRAFVGREDLLKHLHDWFKEPRSYPSEPASCVLYGMGGIGKSQTAVKYSYIYKDEYDFIFWVTAETIPKLIGSFSLIASKVGIEGIDSSNVMADDSAIEKSREWLEKTTQKWLLIFDNVETQQSIEQFWPSTAENQSSIIITSQQPDLRNLTTHGVAIKSLTVDQGAKLLLMARYPDTKPLDGEETAAAELSREVGGLPLAIAHIGGYIAQTSYTLARFREIAKQRNPQIWMAEAPSTIRDYQKRLAIVWDFAIEQLSPDAANLIDILAFLNPDSIPESMLLAELRGGSTWKLKTTSAEIFLMDMAHALAHRCLISVEQGKFGSYFTIHRSLQTGLLQKLDNNKTRRARIFDHAFDIVRRMTPFASPIQVPNPKLWPQFNMAIPHVLTLGLAFSASDPPMRGSFGLAKLLYDAGFNSWEREQIPDGIKMLDLAENVLNGLGHDMMDSLRADIHAIQGMFTDSNGGRQRSIGLKRRYDAVTIRRHVIKKIEREGQKPTRTEEILLQNAVNDYAYCLLQSNRYAEAEKSFESCFATYQRWGTEKEIPFEYSKYFHNIGVVRMYQGRHQEAIESLRRAIGLTQAAMGGNQITYKVLRDTYMYACVLTQAGKLQEALKLHSQILKDRESLCGENSEVTLESYYAVGAMCEYTGDLEGSRKWLSRSIELAPKTRWHKMSLGRAHVHLARVLRALAVDLDQAEKHEQYGRDGLLELKEEVPEYIKGVKDMVAVYDSLHSFCEGRFTNTALLKIIQADPSVSQPPSTS